MAEHPPEQIDGGDFVLRRPHPEDAQLVADTVASNLGRLSVWMGWAATVSGTVEDQRRRILQARTHWDDGSSFQYLALHSGTGAHLGNFALERRIGPGALELGYWLAEDATGYGYATMAVRLLTEVALGLDDIDHVEIHCDAANVRSLLVPDRLGYRLDRIDEDDIVTPAESGRSLVWVYPA